jgi:putative transcriptional regulator
MKKDKGTAVKAGTLLVAEPFMIDPNFKRAVVLLCDHEREDGTIGFILNKPLKMRVDELVADFPEFEGEVFYGGPVANDTIHYLHNQGDLIPDSIAVAPGIYWGGDFEQIKFLISSHLIKPKDIRFYVGYSGWSPGQLTDELKYGSWVLADMDPNYLYNTKSKKLWSLVMDHKGDNYTVIATLPESLNLN